MTDHIEEARKIVDRIHRVHPWKEECEGDIAAALAAAEERGRLADGWMPIETAPRDGTDVLLFHTYHGCIQGRFCAGEWSDDTPISPSEYSGAVWAIGDVISEEEVEEFPIDAPCGPYGDGPITHWMPLPAPPAPTKEPTP